MDATTPGDQITRETQSARTHLHGDAAADYRKPGFTYAEVTAGGVPLSELRLETMESRLCPGLYLCGEICDVDGRIGGYNFQWAWSVVTSSALRSDNLFMHFSAALVMLIARLFIQGGCHVHVKRSCEIARTGAHSHAHRAQQTDDLIVAHDYRDVASLVTNAAAALLQSATYLMLSKDEDAFEALGQADDYLDAVYDIIDSEIEEE